MSGFYAIMRSMILHFIAHSSFLLEGEENALLFDYYGEGEIPRCNKKLIVLTSHFHQDHYNKVIFSLNAEKYILSDTIKLKEIPFDKRERTRRVREGETIKVGDITIKTGASTDAGIGFYFDFEGKKFYFAGDNNIWYWDEDDRDMEEKFLQNIAFFKEVDIAFLPLDPRLGENAFLSAKVFEKEKHPSLIVPMHMWKDYSLPPLLARMIKTPVLQIRVEKRDFEL